MTNTASLRTKAGRRASLLAGVLVCALLATGADAQAATRPTTESAGLNDPSTYGIDWDDVPTEPTKTVVKVTAENCLCDLTEGTCDANCCCDPDCDSNEKAQFTECATCVYDGANAAMNGKVCLPEGRSPPSLEYCLPSSTVSRVNLLSSSSLGVVTQQKADMSFLSQQLCIKDDNSASLGKYFLDPGFATDDILKSSVTLQSERFWNPVPAAASETQPKYRHNDTIGVVTAASGATLPGNKFVLPGATFSGVCGWTNVIGYNMPLPASAASEDATCLVPIDDTLSKSCTTLLNAKYLVNDLKLAKTPGSSATPTEAPTISSMKYRSRIGGKLTDLTGTGTVPDTTFTAGSGSGTKDTCNFAVVEAHYVITHDGSGSISSFAVDLVFADVMTSNRWSAVYTNTLADPGNPSSVRVKYTVSWKLSAETVVPRSGAPGYVVGAPLLAGTKDTSSGKNAVARLKDGLTIPGAGPDGRCSGNSKSTVRFGMSQSSSCAIPLSQNNLKTFCQGSGDKAVADYMYDLISVASVLGGTTPDKTKAPGSSVPLPAQLMDGLLYGTLDSNYDLSAKTVMVAAWANANYENIADWKSCDATDTTDCATELTAAEQLTKPSGDSAMSWDETTKTCKNVAVGVNIDVLTAKVGHLDHAQSKVQRVKVSWNLADWTYTDLIPRTDESPWDDAADSRQDFLLKSTVHFVEMAQDAPEGVKPASPPILPTLPADVFYPFLSAGPAGGRAAASAAWCVALVAAIFVAWVTARGDESY